MAQCKKNIFSDFLPVSKAEMDARGWDYVDVVLITGDAYVDHPSFGIALIGRWLEAHEYRVAILSQPRYDRSDDFTQFGRPRLFFGITAGNLDSIVANYTGNAKVRDRDDYSPGGNPYFGKDKSRTQRRRPDRATILYTNLARAAYPDVPTVLGGLEASLRRFVHYDYQQQKLRASVLADSKADLLVYGMGERAVLEIANRLSQREELNTISGTCERLTEKQQQTRQFDHTPLILPSWQEIQKDTGKFMEAELSVDKLARSLSSQQILQKQQAVWILQNRPALPLDTKELDTLYSLPFVRASHPTAGDVPAYGMIQHSVTIVRGCSGNCSFCAISRHQGSVVTSRSKKSVVAEVREIAKKQDFKGTISDLGGPTANLYGASCASPKPCKRHDCLYPKVCHHLQMDEDSFIELLKEVAGTKGVKHVFVSSGLRMELLLKTPKLLACLLSFHTPGAMKIAPEHTEEKVLRLMHKPSSQVFEKFITKCRTIAKKTGDDIHFSPYFISAHPGCTKKDMERLVKKVKELDLSIRQFQDFTPTPGTLSTAMYVTGIDRDTKKNISVARKASERRAQRSVLEKMRSGQKNFR